MSPKRRATLGAPSCCGTRVVQKGSASNTSAFPVPFDWSFSARSIDNRDAGVHGAHVLVRGLRGVAILFKRLDGGTVAHILICLAMKAALAVHGFLA